MGYERIEELDIQHYKKYLLPRDLNSHKGLFGHVLIVGGDYGYSGATRLAAEAALRTGSGLVSVATRPENALNINNYRPEIMCHGINTVKALQPLLMKATVIIVGPGLGQSKWAKALVTAIFKVKKPLVVDADALNLLAKKPEKHSHWILTPHVGEAARLLKTSTEDIQKDRLISAKLLQKKYGGIIVLKGAGTLITGSQTHPAMCSAGNPGMATAGMGDVLSGVIGALLAQHVNSFDAAKLGVLLHALAGDFAAEGGERGMVASDLFPYLRLLVNPK